MTVGRIGDCSIFTLTTESTWTTVWSRGSSPLNIVNATLPAGVIIPEIPKRFYRDNGKPRYLSFLTLARTNPPNAATRVAVLIRLSEILAWLDVSHLVHGDLSAKNVVWCATPAPSSLPTGQRPGTSLPRPTETAIGSSAYRRAFAPPGT